MTLSNYIKKLKTFEGCRLKAYKDIANVVTIGYGFTKSVIPDLTIESTMTQEEADKQLKKIVKKHIDVVVKECKKHNLMFTCNQIIALTDFCYNCGFGALQNIMKYQSHDEIVQHLILYNKATINGVKQTVQGLVKRREWEKEVYLKKCSCSVPCSYRG